MEHVLSLKNRQLSMNLIDCLEGRVGIRNAIVEIYIVSNLLGIGLSCEIFELLVSSFFVLNCSLASHPVLIHLCRCGSMHRLSVVGTYGRLDPK